MESISGKFTVADPDLQMIHNEEDSPSLILAVEAGFSQPSADLELRIKELFRKTSIQVAILVDIKEKPDYKNPLARQKNIEILKSEQDYLHGQPKFLIQQYCEMTAAVQVFGKDPETREPVEKTPRITFFGEPKLVSGSTGTPAHEAHPDLNTKISDFVQRDDEIYQKELTFQWDILRKELERARRHLALGRYLTAIRKLKSDGKI
ncbi:hypothetical protein MGYG_07150 [Nannizzia gypsea CBS 118893]|uniref:Uncharacterized protein n=1 Tax=Arthroderma gypseum (strain ATCC MYA-4604 / CBS 118893) TaxID=535722 RepID=E4V278_ARTGP|nr:hypothetical protein MGYG_07150 [Nannizzia gypsea CBS 118893]EFR04143.1 hypothetical protein MGYG_07150 [Nannizzia gypsea CBS 118893]